MGRKFKTADYEAMLKETVSIGDCLPESHLARFVVKVISELDLSIIYSKYGTKGGVAIAPEILLGLLIYGYATGIFSSRKIEQASHEIIPFRYIGGNMHPDHDTIASFRSRFLVEMQEIFVQVLEKAIGAGVMELADISIDGTKIHADASKSKAVSHKRLEEIQKQLQMEVAVLVKMGEEADESKKVLENVDIAAEISRRHDRLNNLAEAKQVIEGRAQERYEEEQRAYAEKMTQREQYMQQTGRKPSGRVPAPPFLVLATKNNTTLPTQNRG